MTEPIRARNKPLRDLKPGHRICDRCGIEHGSELYRECEDCRLVRDYVPRWWSRWDKE